MAEIHVQPRRSPAWLWILAAVAGVFVIWALAGWWDRDSSAMSATPARTGVPAVSDPNGVPDSGIGEVPPPAVAALLMFANAPADSPAAPAHEYAADGIRRLTQALKVVIEKESVAGAPVRERFGAFQAKADRIQADPSATTHAGQVRDVFTEAGALMSEVQQDRWPDRTALETDIAEVRSAGAAIDAARPLLDQTAGLEAYFDRAADAVKMMAEAPAGER